MTRNAYAATGAVLLVAAAASWLWFGRSALELWAGPSRPAAGDGAAGDREPTLYCEFADAADRTPRVGFFFLIEAGKSPPSYTLIFQRPNDAARAGSGGEDAPRPEWRMDGAESPAVLHAPDDTTAISLYDYDPSKRGITWFEAGLRSPTDKHLGGRCRRSAT